MNYEIKLIAKECDVGTLIDTVKGSAMIVSVLPIVEKDTERRRSSYRNYKYANGKRHKGITGQQLVLEILSHGPSTKNEIVDKFMEHGFAASSSVSVISKLHRSGEIVIAPDDRILLSTVK